ncbi:MAG: DUF1349 domain-containing protein, partial [Clostridiales bacterium]|nr:DUF1349 domain-containing protein [Clostridiales bacterium]
MKKQIRMLLAAALSGVLLCQPLGGMTSLAAEDSAVYLSDLTWKSLSVGWGNPGLDKGLAGREIALRGSDGQSKTYAKGLVLHAPSEISYDLTDSGAKAFKAFVGIDVNGNQGSPNSASCAFIVKVDGEEKYKSEVIRIGTGNREVSVDLPEDAKTLTLVSTDGGDGNNSDHSVWADAKLILDGDKLNDLKNVTAKAADTLLEPGQTTKITAAGTLVGGQAAVFPAGGLTYASSDESVAAVAADGTVTAKTPGVATITATGLLGGISRSDSVDILVPGENTDNRVWTVSSPGGNIQAFVGLNAAGRLFYAMRREGKILLRTSPMGFVTSLADFTEGLTLQSAPAAVELDETYSVLSSRKDSYRNHAMERIFTFQKDGAVLHLQTRAYDDGFAFRYVIEGGRPGAMTVLDEATAFGLPADSTVWAMPYGGGAYNYEDEFKKYDVNQVNGGQSMPMLYEAGEDLFVLLCEADLHGNYIASQLTPKGDGMFKTDFVPQQTGDVETAAPFSSPWRTALAGTLADIVEGSMAENVVNDPAEDQDYSWVVPGGSSWSWIAEAGSNQIAAQHDPDIIKKYIDLAADMGWKYYIMDEGWQPPAGGGDSRYAGYYDWFDEIVEYADQRGIGLIAWVLADDLRTEAQRVARLDDWAAHGVKGIKVDFFDRETQDRTGLLDEVYAHCAKLHMVVNAHGANKPTGEVRSNPNVLTREAIKGREYGGLSVYQYTILPFTRTAIGPADVTETVYPGWNESMGFTNALSVLVQSGIHCYASKPEHYLNTPVYTLYKDMPSVWDDTKLVDGYPGEFAAIMRRSGESWYGAAVSVEARTVQFPMDMLGDGDYYAFIYKDGASRKEIELEIQKVDKTSVLSLPVLENGGCTIKVVKDLPSGPESITLDTDSLTLEMQETAALTPTITPANPDIKQLSYTSSDESVAKVDTHGKVTGVGRGTAVITVASPLNSEIQAVCTVRVTGSRYALDEEAWSVNRPQPDAVRYVDENTAAINALKGDVGEADRNPLKNVFYMTPADADFTITAKVTGGMTAAFQTAALVAFTDDNNLVAAMRRYHPNFGGNIFEHMTYLGGYNEITAADNSKNAPAWLRLEKRGDAFLSYYSMDGSSFVKIGEKDAPAIAGSKDLKIGFMATVGSGENADITLTFSDFVYQSGGTEKSIPFAVENTADPLDAAVLSADEAVQALTPANSLTAADVMKAVTAAVGDGEIAAVWAEDLVLT